MLGRPRKQLTRKELGRIGEDNAARCLASRGYHIKERNFRAAGGAEIDIIAEHRDALVFIEVKLRTSTDFARPRDSVTPGKQRQIARAAAAYLASRERRERVTRFDVVEVVLTPAGRVTNVDVIQGAFQAT